MQKNGKLESLVSQRVKTETKVCGDGIHPPAPYCRGQLEGRLTATTKEPLLTLLAK